MSSGWSLKTRLISAYTVSFLFLIGISGWGLHTQSNLSKTVHYLGEVTINKLSYISEMREHSLAAVHSVTYLALPNKSPEHIKRHKDELTKRIKQYEENFAEFSSLQLTSEEQNLSVEVDGLWSKVVAPSKKIAALAHDESPETQAKIKELIDTEVDQAMAEFSAKIRLLDVTLDKVAEKYDKQANAEAEFSFWISVVASIVGLILSVTIGLWTSSSIAKEITSLIKELTAGADKIAKASGLVSDSSNVLSEGVTEQASALQETASSIDEISAMVKRNSENASVSIEKSGASRDAVQEGTNSVKDMLRSMDEIASSNTSVMNQIEQSNAQISEITKVISEIANKTRVINDIVFQTKLLSFNASVEAARAGEHGKGFAVVAEEVGNLAQMSGNAAQEISTMLEASIKKVEGIVTESSSRVEKLLGESKSRVEGGTLTARRCGEVLTHIERSINDLDKMVQEIAQASGEQATGVGEISKAMNQLNQVTQQNSSASQKSASVALELNTDVRNIRTQVTLLEKLVHGGDGAPAVNVAAASASSDESRNESEGRVIQIEKAKPSKSVGSSAKKAVGAENLPDENDPRFQDV